jgi:hypothetical protein
VRWHSLSRCVGIRGVAALAFVELCVGIRGVVALAFAEHLQLLVSDPKYEIFYIYFARLLRPRDPIHAEKVLSLGKRIFTTI